MPSTISQVSADLDESMKELQVSDGSLDRAPKVTYTP